MFLERRTVSRKTAKDGRLEITKRAAERITGAFDVELSGARSPASLGTMECTCRGADNPHVHYFVESPVLQQLSAGAEVDLHLDTEGGVVNVVLAT
jgi:hypothetical protein